MIKLSFSAEFFLEFGNVEGMNRMKIFVFI